MRTILAVAVVALAGAGCAGLDNARYASTDCKVVPVAPASVSGKGRPATSLERRMAEMDLGASEYRRRQLEEQGRFRNNVEEALEDCR